MEKMREILKQLMERAGHNPYDIERLTALPAATTYRFLNGDIQQPRFASIKAWTKVYGLTESQLRGDVPIDGIEAKTPSPELQDLLPLDEYKHVKLVKSLDEGTRGIIFRLAEALAEPKAEYSDESIIDRRKEPVLPNPQQRIGEMRYKPPPVQRRMKNHNERHKHSA